MIKKGQGLKITTYVWKMTFFKELKGLPLQFLARVTPRTSSTGSYLQPTTWAPPSCCQTRPPPRTSAWCRPRRPSAASRWTRNNSSSVSVQNCSEVSLCSTFLPFTSFLAKTCYWLISCFILKGSHSCCWTFTPFSFVRFTHFGNVSLPPCDLISSVSVKVA